MLLRRVIEHVRAQNWTAVVIDFLIVVVGVFIGIQVANWNDVRKADRELDTALDNVAQNISDTIASRTDQINWTQRMIDGHMHMLRLLDGEEISEQEREDLNWALSRSSPPPPSPDRFVALMELQSSGQLKDVKPVELRKALSELLAQKLLGPAFYDRDLARLTAPDFAPGILRYEPRKSERSNHTFFQVVDVDLELARNDPAFRQRLQQILSAYASKNDYERTSRAMDTMILAMLEAEGHEPSGNWLYDNFEAINADAYSDVTGKQ